MTPRAEEARLRAIVARVAKVDSKSIGLDDSLKASAGLDSLSSLRVAAAVEREFGVKIPDEKLHDLPTLRAILEYLARPK